MDFMAIHAGYKDARIILNGLRQEAANKDAGAWDLLHRAGERIAEIQRQLVNALAGGK